MSISRTREYANIYDLAGDLGRFPEDATGIKVTYVTDAGEPEKAGESQPVSTDVGAVPAESPGFKVPGGPESEPLEPDIEPDLE